MRVDGRAGSDGGQVGAGLGDSGEGETGERKGGGKEAAVEGNSGDREAVVRGGTREGGEEEGVGCGVGGREEVRVRGGAGCDGERGQLGDEGEGAAVACDNEARVSLFQSASTRAGEEERAVFRRGVVGVHPGGLETWN